MKLPRSYEDKFDEGVKAFQDNCGPVCPYPPGSKESLEWLAGYEYAQRQAEEDTVFNPKDERD
jgi:hypothetical protein